MPIRRIDHVTVWTQDLEATRAFYTDVLGLADGPRPNFGFAGYWFYSGERAVVHVQLAPGPVGPSDASALNHFALAIDGLEPLLARLEAHGVAYYRTRVPNAAVHQIFLKDPNGVTIEINDRV